MSTIIVRHRPARTIKYEVYDDLAEALARMFDLRRVGTSGLVMYEAHALSTGGDQHGA